MYNLSVKQVGLSNLFNSIVPELFSFAFALVPDDLQAQQVVIDSIALFSSQQPEELEWLFDHVLFSAKEKRKRVNLELLRNCYSIGNKRYEQLKQGFNSDEQLGIESKAFFRLLPDERAIVYLKHKRELSLSEIQSITNIPRAQVLATLQSSRDLLLKYKGEVFEWLKEKEVDLTGGKTLNAGPIIGADS